jgi:DNA phosphorothioation-associated putative methyltransferase
VGLEFASPRVQIHRDERLDMANKPAVAGKRVGNSVYIHREATPHIDAPLLALLNEAVTIAASTYRDWNVARLSLADREVALLNYPHFDTDPFPSLHSSCLVKLVAEQKIVMRDFSSSLNPPVLHRKELLLTPEDERRPNWARITGEAEAIGLFSDPSRIGWRREWLQKISDAGYRLVGESFIPYGNALDTGNDILSCSGDTTIIERHRTALVRATLSAPMQALLRLNLLQKHTTIFDYGCGRGGDVDALRKDGYSISGWDPYFAPAAPRLESDFVNLGFVLNVIEDRNERDQTLIAAFKLARIALSIAVMTDGASVQAGQPYRDGFLTTRKTFQKYFGQHELKSYIESVLQHPVALVAPGIALAFSSEEHYECFCAERQRSSRVHVRARIVRQRASRPSLTKPAVPTLYEENRSDFDRLWNFMLEIGREPTAEEAKEFNGLILAVGSLSKALKVCLTNNDSAELESAKRERIEDLTVYFALRAFQGDILRRTLVASLAKDVKTFFGSLVCAKDAGSDLLRSIASPNIIETACELASKNGLGHYVPSGYLQIHSRLIRALPPVLRVYVGAASAIYGDVEAADLVKIHTRSGKLTLLEFDNFDISPAPTLRRRIKIHLQDQSIDIFEYGQDYEPTVLPGKARFMNEEFPEYDLQLDFDKQLSRIFEGQPEYGPTVSEFKKILDSYRLELSGWSLRRSETCPDLNEMCGKNFSYRDLISCGDTAKSFEIANLPHSPATYNALRDLADYILDPVIEYYGAIELTFGFCSRELAREIRRRGIGRIAPALDQHACAEVAVSGDPICDRGGAAVDFLVQDEDMYEVAEWIATNLPFDRIYLYSPYRPIHVSFGPQQTRQITFVERSQDGRVRPRLVTDFSSLPR